MSLNGTGGVEDRCDHLNGICDHFEWWLSQLGWGKWPDFLFGSGTGCLYQWGAPTLPLLVLLLYTTVEVGKHSYCVIFSVVYSLWGSIAW